MNLKELREKNKLTQTALARSLGVSSNTISAIEGGRLKLSPKLSDKIKEVYEEIIEPETRRGQAPRKRAGRKAAAAEQKPEAPEKKTRRRRKKAEVEKPVAAEGTEAAAGEKTKRKAGRPKKAHLVIQSPLGGEITPEAILAKIGAADTVYVRVDQNKAYWVKGEESGSIDIW